MPSNPLRWIRQKLGRSSSRPGAGAGAAIKLVVVGDGGCGKRSLLTRLIRGVFPESYHVPKVFDSYRVNLHSADASVALEIWVIRFQADFEWLRPIVSPHVALVCYAIDSSDSFDNVVEKWMPLLRHYNLHTPVILVGCRKDYRHEDDGSGIVRQQQWPGLMMVDAAQALEYSAQIGATAYIECSAWTGEGVNELLSAVARVAAGLDGH
ncbi:Rho GTPase Rho1 [Zopfochytrium polystomum]|nr:Rho GTPase Rho1 [Zopfochytrium polystomum]